MAIKYSVECEQDCYWEIAGSFASGDKELKLQYLTCCAVDYLTDHLNGDREALVSIAIHEDMTRFDIESALISELEQLEKYPKEISQEELSALTSNASDDAITGYSMMLKFTEGEDDRFDDNRLWFALTW